MLEIKLASRSGSTHRRFVGVVKEYMEIVGINAEEAGNRVKWSQMMNCGDTRREQPKEDHQKLHACIILVS